MPMPHCQTVSGYHYIAKIAQVMGYWKQSDGVFVQHNHLLDSFSRSGAGQSIQEELMRPSFE